MPSLAQRLGILLRRASLMVAVASGVTTLVLIGMVISLSRVVLDSTRVTLAALTSLEESIQVVDAASGSLEEGLSDAASGISRAGASAGEVTGVVGRVADLASTDLPESLEAVDRAMPALIEAGAVIDRTLRALSILGVGYSPEVPFDEALAEVDRSLEGLPEQLRSEGEALSELVPTVRGMEGDLVSLSGRLEALGTDLGQVARMVDEYQETATEARAAVEGAERVVGAGRWVAVAGLVAAGVVWMAVALTLRRAADLIDPIDLEPSERLPI